MIGSKTLPQNRVKDVYLTLDGDYSLHFLELGVKLERGRYALLLNSVYLQCTAGYVSAAQGYLTSARRRDAVRTTYIPGSIPHYT
jgi:hypothetical protein